ncbi:MAG: hypothetical protein KC609_15510 [Myxococcales bacterium]|nr:hypothetical protein [Myxococcales bacterium]
MKWAATLLVLLSLGLILGGCPTRTVYVNPEQPPPQQPPPPSSWNDRATFSSLHVLGHHFHTATVRNGSYGDGTQCSLYFKVSFFAPSTYYHRFQTKLMMSGGAWVRSPVFFNQGYGQREYRFSFDTTNQGCWARRYHRITFMTVHGCSGYGCYVRPIP